MQVRFLSPPPSSRAYSGTGQQTAAFPDTFGVLLFSFALVGYLARSPNTIRLLCHDLFRETGLQRFHE